MNENNLHNYIFKNQAQINRIINRIRFKNVDYSIYEIKGMIHTAIWETDNPNERGIYLAVLNRVLQEKGYRYKDSVAQRPLVNLDDMSNLSTEGNVSQPFAPDMLEQVDQIFVGAGLDQDEVFVTSLSFGLSTPEPLTGEYKKILDNIEDLYYIRSLTKQEISNVIKKNIREVDTIRKSAIKKLEQFCENKTINWSR